MEPLAFCRFEQIKLNCGADISSVTENTTVVIFKLHVVYIFDIMILLRDMRLGKFLEYSFSLPKR